MQSPATKVAAVKKAPADSLQTTVVMGVRVTAMLLRSVGNMLHRRILIVRLMFAAGGFPWDGDRIESLLINIVVLDIVVSRRDSVVMVVSLILMEGDVVIQSEFLL